MRSHNNQSKFTDIIILLAIFLTSLPLVFASPSSTPTKPRSTNYNNREINDTILSRRQMSEGSSCEGSEGQWNCLTDQWQRCAAGRWSVVMDCAEGTMCSPSGLTYDFAVQFANGAAGGPATSDAIRRRDVRWVVPKALVVLGLGMVVQFRHGLI